jgi:hypothetical protein
VAVKGKRVYSICVRDWKGEPLEIGRYSDLGQAIIVLLALECENDFVELHSIRVSERNEKHPKGS